MGFRFLINLHKSFKSRSLSSCSSKIFKNHAPVNYALYNHYSMPSYAENPGIKIHNRWHGGHAHRDHDNKEGEKVFRLGLAADIGLAAGKSVAGYLSGSTALIADAAHSISDIVLSGVALLSFKASRVPKDKEHPYGHGKFETLGALGISGVLLATGGGIAWHALDVMLGILSSAPEVVNQSFAHEHMPDDHHGGHHHGFDMDHPVLALNMIVISIAVKEGLYWITKMAGERTGSGLMKANAWHHRADAVSSVVALVGVGGSILGIKFLDPLAGILVSGMILKAGLKSGYQSVLELVDAAVPSFQLDPYKSTISTVEGVKGYNHLRGRRAGSSLYLDVDIEVDPFSSVSVAHNVGENVRHQLQKFHPEVTEVFIHVEPSTSHISPGVINGSKDSDDSDHHSDSAKLEQTDAEDTISTLLSSSFSQKLVVERITRHTLQGQFLFEVEVSMSPDMLIREAIEVAKEAEARILEAVPSIMHVSIQLRLGQPMPELED